MAASKKCLSEGDKQINSHRSSRNGLVARSQKGNSELDDVSSAESYLDFP